MTSSSTWPLTRHRRLPTYWRSFGTKPLSPAFFEMASKSIEVTTFWPFRSRDVIGHLTFDSQVAISYRCSVVTKSLSPADSEIMGTKHIGVTTLTFQDHVTSSVMWRDHSIPRLSFPIGAPLSPSRYIQPFPRYWAPNISGSRPRPFRVMWRHQSHDHLIRRLPFPIGAPLSLSLLSPAVSEIKASNIFGSRPWPFTVTWRHRSRDQSTRDGPFSIGGPLDPSLYL